MRFVLAQYATDTTLTMPQQFERMFSFTESIGAADLIILPELWASGFFAFDNYLVDAEALDRAIVPRLQALAVRHNSYVHGGSFLERGSDDRVYNTSILLDRTGRVLVTYRKIHLFGYGSEEARLLSPGCRLETVCTALGTLGLTTCYDLRFPETYRALLHKGADLFLVPAAWPEPRIGHWRLLAQARAIENQAVVIACNGAGPQFGSRLGGRSLAVDPWGEVLAEAGDGEELLTAEVDVGLANSARASFPAVADIAPTLAWG